MTGSALSLPSAEDVAAVSCTSCGARGSVEAVSQGRAGDPIKQRRPVWGCKLCGWLSKELPCRLCGLLPSQGLVMDRFGVMVDPEVQKCRLEDQRRGEPGGGGSGPKRQRKPGDDLLRGRAEQEPWPGLVEPDQYVEVEQVVKRSEVVRSRVTPGEKRMFQLEAKARGLTESELLHLAISRLLFVDSEWVPSPGD